MNTALIDELYERGLVAQSTPINELKAKLLTPQTVYCGFDPTAGSLHIGHLVPLMVLKRFQDAGHTPIALVGGATGMIGDPSFKDSERCLNTPETVVAWVEQLSAQIQNLMSAHQKVKIRIVNNSDWVSGMNVIQFLRDVGKHFSVNALVNRESVKVRLQRADQGISYTEFSYALLQAYDFVHLNKMYGCTLQIGGSDQWGNIVSGIDLTRRINKNTVFGMTLPLITKSDGTKFGKTEGGAIWLDKEKTSPYAFYQFWLNTSDVDVYRFLQYYTFLSVEQIQTIEQADSNHSGKPQAQRILAEEVTRFVHGNQGLESAKRITHALFTGELNALNRTEIEQLMMDGLPSCQVDSKDDLASVLVSAGLASSKRVAREHIRNDAIRINGEVATDRPMTHYFPMYDQYWIIQRGKKSYCLCFL